MADSPFDRTIINLRERPLSSDINQAQSQLDRTLRYLMRLFGSAQVDGVPSDDEVRFWSPDSGFGGANFLNSSYFVAPVSGMMVKITSGLGWQRVPADVPAAVGGISGLDDLEELKPLLLTADQNITLDASPAGGQSRIDIIEVIADRRAENSTSRDVLDTGSGVFAATGVDKTLAWDHLGRTGRVVAPASSTTGIGYKVGVAATTGTEVAPATTSGYAKIAEILVTGGVTSIAINKVKDTRALYFPYGMMTLGVLLNWPNAAGAINGVISSPPGLRCAMYRPSAAGVHARILFPYPFGVIIPTFSIRHPGTPATQKNDVGRVDVQYGLVDSTIQSEVADIARNLNPLQLAIGQAVSFVDVSFITISNVATQADVVTVPAGPLEVHAIIQTIP